MGRLWHALLLIFIIGTVTAGLRWNTARIAPMPEPNGDLLVDVRHADWADIYVPAGHKPVPALLFSPGFGAPIRSYSTFLTDIASHGFLVVAVPHPPVKDAENERLFDFAPLAEKTLPAAMDRLERDSVAVRVDTARVAVVGHSVGGAAAALACTDPRFKAAVDIDGSLYGRVVHEGVACPFLIIERSLTRVDTADKPVFHEERSQGRLHEDSVIAHSADVDWVTVDGLDHMSFTDPELAFRTSNWMKEAVGLRLDAAESQRVTADLIVDFLSDRLGVEQEHRLIGGRLPRGIHQVTKP